MALQADPSRGIAWSITDSVIDAEIRKSDVIDALTSASDYGVFHILLTLVQHPVKKLHIAVLGRMDDALARWVGALPHETQKV